MDVNIPLLRKAVEWAEAEAAKPDGVGAWDQGDYATPMPQVCGTAYCIAGWTLHEDGWSDDRIDVAANDGTAGPAAAALLGIPVDFSESSEGNPLFDALNSISDVRRIAEDIAGERL